LKNVHKVHGDGTRGYPEKAPFDRIMVTAAGPELPVPLLKQLKEGGRMLMPVGGSFFQELLLVEKRKGGIDSKPVMSVIFVPLIGEYGHAGMR
jgi:protein-L-isoaspartate(D-aspartate) O-methyltransferase